jgi:hypothetical protein
MFVMLSVGCTDKDDTDAPTEVCDATASPKVSLGRGTGGAFEALESGTPVGVQQAPQGGNGVSILIQTEGLKTGGPVNVKLDVEIAGVNEGSFLAEEIQLFCQDDGTGMIFGQVVGFDDAKYPTQADLIPLDDTSVDLLVTVTDAEGDVASGRTSVEVDVVGDTGAR